MSEAGRQIILSVLTAVMAAVVLTPMFVALKLLLDAGLGVVLVAVVAAGLLLVYLLRLDSRR